MGFTPQNHVFLFQLTTHIEFLKKGGRVKCQKVLLIKDGNQWEEEVFIGCFFVFFVAKAQELLF